MAPNRVDRTGDTIRRAVEAARQSSPATVSAAGGEGLGGVAGGGRSIQDGEGRMYVMVDVSTVGGPDVVAP